MQICYISLFLLLMIQVVLVCNFIELLLKNTRKKNTKKTYLMACFTLHIWYVLSQSMSNFVLIEILSFTFRSLRKTLIHSEQ